MNILEKYANDMLLPVNVSKTKALLIHNIISPTLPRIKYNNQPIEFVWNFKYLGITITCKLGWGMYINNVLKSIRKIYNAMKILFYKIPKQFINIRRKRFLAYALPHFIWMFPTWFFFTEKQKEKIYSLFCSGVRLVYGLKGWDDISTMILSQEKSLYDFIFHYGKKFAFHLESSIEATQYQHTWTAYLASKSPDKSC
ncbi:unnamed protein product [Rotaria magnacalcarata]|uniref:Reverse transcriptase n=1 Tax=Rotaria magnacalcarata TaxID=392030 RepID=A0A815Z4C3_9BILA|nr:unnamed protein product [Rotaria magnacalcarata]CAF5211554.1 unnamed protein product [Rotaria magnacalcarata]